MAPSGEYDNQSNCVTSSTSSLTLHRSGGHAFSGNDFVNHVQLFCIIFTWETLLHNPAPVFTIVILALKLVVSVNYVLLTLPHLIGWGGAGGR